jgi:hypothetical protein
MEQDERALKEVRAELLGLLWRARRCDASGAYWKSCEEKYGLEPARDLHRWGAHSPYPW